MEITLEIPENVLREARAVADRTGQNLEDILSDWLGRMADELPVDTLSDARVLELCDLQMSAEQQRELSDLLARNREGQLDRTDYEKLDSLMRIYRQGTLRKAEALKVAVQRGLRPPLR